LAVASDIFSIEAFLVRFVLYEVDFCFDKYCTIIVFYGMIVRLSLLSFKAT